MSKKAMRRSPTSRNERRKAIAAKQVDRLESPWKTLSRELWDADHGEGDYDKRLEEARRAVDH